MRLAWCNRWRQVLTAEIEVQTKMSMTAERNWKTLTLPFEVISFRGCIGTSLKLADIFVFPES